MLGLNFLVANQIDLAIEELSLAARVDADAQLAAKVEHDGIAVFLERWLARSLFAGLSHDQAFFDEIVTAEIGQVGTQWDGLAHPAIRIQGVSGWKDGLYFYNGFRAQDVGTARGFKKNGPEKQPGFFTRGILIDIAARKGVKRRQKG